MDYDTKKQKRFLFFVYLRTYSVGSSSNKRLGWNCDHRHRRQSDRKVYPLVNVWILARVRI